MDTGYRYAPGWPGIPARWTSSAKSAVGTSLSTRSAVWFTLSHGIFNEIYFPRIDQACVRDMGMIVTDGAEFRSEEKRDADSRANWIADGVPAFKISSLCRQGRYRIEKEILSDPRRDALLQLTRFFSLQGTTSNYRLFVLLAPHLGNQGAGNTGWVGEYKGVPMLFAERNGSSVALACSVPWKKRCTGFVGHSDGWQDLMNHGELSWDYDRAENGNVALTGEIDLDAGEGGFLLALGFGRNAAEAGNRARAALQDGFDPAREEYCRHWRDWHKTLVPLDRTVNGVNLYRASASVVRSHEAFNFSGGIIASLSIPWGTSRGDNDLGGYHLIWPRDLVEAAGALLAAGSHAEVLRVLRYLQATQEPDGHWGQNMWLDGTPYWSGVQMDETALPVLLVDLARRQGGLAGEDLGRFWHMVRQAVSYLVCQGPVSPQDRWEEDPGYSPFTVAAEIAALLAAADLAELNAEPGVALYLRECADVWNGSLERWMYVTGTDWSRDYGVPGYYVRIASLDPMVSPARFQEMVPVKNRAAGQDALPLVHLVSPDVLALVRFGLRAPDDPRIRATLVIIDALLKVDTAGGPAWRRYNGDGYGEHEDGSPFDGTGLGRAWPLLTGERAHYELAAGNLEEARRLQWALESFASVEGLLPEQSWDADDLPEHELFFGRPTGSAMPLVWTHAEYLKLLRSLRDGRVFDMPPQPVQRYQVDKVVSPRLVWRFNHKLRSLPAGMHLRIETLSPALVYWSSDAWDTMESLPSRDTGLGLHLVDLDTAGLAAGKRLIFTFYWPESGNWEGIDFMVGIEAGGEEGR